MPVTSTRCVNSSTAANGSRKCGYAADGWSIPAALVPFAAESLAYLALAMGIGPAALN